MALPAVQHTIRDCPVWRAVYDAQDEVQRDWGVTAASAPRLVESPSTVLVLHYCATVAQTKGFLTSRQIRMAMERAGDADRRTERR